MKKKRYKQEKRKKATLLPEDVKVVNAARESGIYVLCGRGDKSEPLYRFYDKATGTELGIGKREWWEGLNKAIQRKWKLQQGG